MKPALLVADGDEMLGNLFVKFLTRKGYEVEAVSGGLECLNRLRQSSPGGLILDLDIPWGGGEGVLAVMQDDPDLARLPVIVTFTTASSDSLAQLSSSPAVTTLPKPFSLAVLLDRIQLALASPRSPLPQ